MCASDNDVVSSGRLVWNHMHLSVVALNGHFTSSGERHVDILVDLVQRLEKLDVQLLQDPCLVGRLHVWMLQSVRATVRGFPEGMPVWTVIGARPPSRQRASC